MNLPADVRVRASGLPSVIRTVEEAIKLIDANLPPDLARLPRWTFARALLAEVMQTRKSKRHEGCGSPTQAGAPERKMA